MVIDRSKSDILAEFESARDRDASCPVTEPTPSTSPTLHRSSSFTVVSQSCVQFQSGQSCLSFYDSSLTRPPAMQPCNAVETSWCQALLLARLMGQYCFARWRLLAWSVVVCNAAGRRTRLRRWRLTQIKSNLFAISSVHNNSSWIDRQAITSHLCLPMTTKPKKIK